MAPLTLTRLYASTGGRKYLEFLDQEFRFTYDRLSEKSAGFFYRGSRFVGQKTKAGHHTFWSRGNGWVYGGIALMLEHLPADGEITTEAAWLDYLRGVR